MTISIFRHAESTANIGMPVDQADTIPLSERGYQQAHKLSLSFNAETAPQLIITSPYIRTHMTAAPTMARFPSVPHEVWPIHEFNYLSDVKHRGSTWSSRAPEAAAYWLRNDPDYVDGEGAESCNQLIGRVDHFIDKANKLPADQNIAVFSHSLFMLAVFLRMTRPELNGAELMRVIHESKGIIQFPNTACMQLRRNFDGKLAPAFSVPAA